MTSPTVTYMHGLTAVFLDPSRYRFTVRVVAAPKTPPPGGEKTYTTTEVQALFAEFMAQHKTRGKK